MRHSKWPTCGPRPLGQFLVPTALLYLLTVLNFGDCRNEIKCPPYHEMPACSCLILDDDMLDIQCSAIDVVSLGKTFQILQGPIKSLSVYDLDSRTTVLPNGITDNVTSPIFHLQLSHSSLEDLGTDSLRGLSSSLESLAVISGRLKHIPQTALSTMKRLKDLNLEGNSIQELGSYNFHNILLHKLNLKGNQLETISENAFWSLEETLMDIDMSENKLRVFPYTALRRLRLLQSLTLAWNEMSDLNVLVGAASQVVMDIASAGSSSGEEMEWPLLKSLNLNSNYLRKLDRDTFGAMRNLKTLSIHLNSIEYVDEEAFSTLSELESIDLSHNKITLLGGGTFRSNGRLVNIDLSNNHIHLVDELFNGLGELRELFLNGNNILHLTSHTFTGSGKITTLYLQGNALRFVESGVFSPLRNLTELRLNDNFIQHLPQDLFLHNERLHSLSLDGNLLNKVIPGTFHNAKALRELRLQNNQIQAVLPGVVDVLPNLEDLYLENNRLTGVKGLDLLKRLRHVSLSRNNLERLSGDMLPGTELSSLSLGHNSLKIIDDGVFVNQSSLSILFLGNNALTHIGPRTFFGLKSLERLYLQKNNISLLHNDCFSYQSDSLSYIDLSYNALGTISAALFTQLSSIGEINLSHNQLTHLEPGAFSFLRTLRILDLSSNKLTVLDFPTMFANSGLEILKSCCNSISDIQLGSGGSGSSSSSGGPSTSTLIASSKLAVGHKSSSIGIGLLKELDLRDNRLNAGILKAVQMQRLEVLQVSGNNLTDLNEEMLTGFPSLNFFAAEKAHITFLPAEIFRKNPSLAVIRLNDNFLANIPDSVFVAQGGGGSGSKLSPLTVRELHLRHNRLRHFPYKALANITALQVLTLSGNRINVLDLARIKLPRLKQLDMNDNQLNKISGSALQKSMPNLEVVDFGENNISRIPEELFKNMSLSQINLGGNALQKIPYALSSAFVPSPFVLNVSSNPLVSYYTENHAANNFSVMDLYLTDTNVTFLNADVFRIYPKLHRLVIRYTRIGSLPSEAFASLTHLNLLDLSENDIEEFKPDAFAGLVQLKSLNLSRNRIRTFSAFHPHLTGLQELDLSHNLLSSLLPEAFANLVSLVSLRLRGNELTNLPADLFGPLARLSVLDLSYNFIETVPTPLLRHLETRISTLKLEENNLSCKCDSKEFREWLQIHPKILAASATSDPGSFGPATVSEKQANFICASPEELKGRSLLEPDPPGMCASPAILKLAIQDVQPSSAVVSWQGRNNSSMSGYMIAYHALDHNNQVKKTRQLPPTSSRYRLPDLQSDTPYWICVLGLANDDNGDVTSSALQTRSADILKDTPFSKCMKMRTLGSTDSAISLLHRRLGVVVGACVGVVVFVVLITSLACVKYRKRREHVQQNGKVDHHVTESLTSSNTVGTLGGGYHHHNTHQNHHHHHPMHSIVHNGPLPINGNGTLGRVPQTTNLSPEYLTYRHNPYGMNGGINGDNGIIPAHTTELEHL